MISVEKMILFWMRFCETAISRRKFDTDKYDGNEEERKNKLEGNQRRILNLDLQTG